MADLTIHVPREAVAAVRASLRHVRAGIGDAIATARASGAPYAGHLVELRDADDALAQLDPDPPGDVVALTAHPELLSDVLHGALADAIETFEHACELDWRGAEPQPSPAEALQRLLRLFTLFEDVQGRGR